jgi:hypothetical protein
VAAENIEQTSHLGNYTVNARRLGLAKDVESGGGKKQGRESQ